MATLAQPPLTPALGNERFFLRAAILMTLIIIAGFSFQLAMGRSSFSSPPLVHAHAIVFMGWVAIYLLQNIFVSTGRMSLHRKLGWVAAGWIVAMLVLGVLVTVAMVRGGRVPFFFRPLQFLIFDPVSLIAFVGLTVAAIRMRRQTEWHRRLHFCGMSILLGPAFGRLLPAPLLQPFVFETILATCLLFPLFGMLADVRRDGHAHPAWKWGIGTMLGILVLTEVITYSSVGTWIYAETVRGSAGASVAALEFAPPPGS